MGSLADPTRSYNTGRFNTMRTNQRRQRVRACVRHYFAIRQSVLCLSRSICAMQQRCNTCYLLVLFLALLFDGAVWVGAVFDGVVWVGAVFRFYCYDFSPNCIIQSCKISSDATMLYGFSRHCKLHCSGPIFCRVLVAHLCVDGRFLQPPACGFRD